MASRAERKEKAKKRRAKILNQICDKICENLDKGQDKAIEIAEYWIQAQIRKNPHEKSMYQDAIREYGRRLKIIARAREAGVDMEAIAKQHG